MPTFFPVEMDYARNLLEDDPEAWERFFLKEVPFMEWVCTRTLERGGRPFTAQDVADDVAQALLRLLQGDRRLLRRFDGRARLSTYVGILARMASLERLRGEKRPPPALVRGGAAPGPVDELLVRERSDEVRSAMALLPGAERRAVEGFYDRGMTYLEIARDMGIAHGDVKALLASARERLGEMLKKNA